MIHAFGFLNNITHKCLQLSDKVDDIELSLNNIHKG